LIEPGIPLQRPGKLRRVESPDLSPVLTHFCGRGRMTGRDVPPDISRLTPCERLESILWEGQLRAFVTYSGGDPAVCFTEATVAGLKFLLRHRGYQPWGLLIERQTVFDAGGGPVWHARQEQCRMLSELDSRIRSWVVRFDSGSDWLEEREWRIVRDARADSPPVIRLNELRLLALLVGDEKWTGARIANCVPVGGSQARRGTYFPPGVGGVPRWRWNPVTADLESLPPLYDHSDLSIR
jgi:hypothetical protein